MRLKLFKFFIFVIVGLCLFSSAYAKETTVQTMSWLGINLSGLFLSSQYLVYDLNTQARNNISTDQYDETRSEGGLGYKINNDLVVWLGVIWTVKNANSDQQRGSWEQITWRPIDNNLLIFSIRSRLEQLADLNDSGIAQLWREKVELDFPNQIANYYTPVLYDEMFLNLTRPGWAGDAFVNQNRLFIGVQIPVVKNTNIQIGYLNRYQVRTPDDKMSNIIYLNLNITT